MRTDLRHPLPLPRLQRAHDEQLQHRALQLAHVGAPGGVQPLEEALGEEVEQRAERAAVEAGGGAVHAEDQLRKPVHGQAGHAAHVRVEGAQGAAETAPGEPLAAGLVPVAYQRRLHTAG